VYLGKEKYILLHKKMIDMSNIDDSSGTSSFEYVADTTTANDEHTQGKIDGKPNSPAMSDAFGGPLGKVVADQLLQSGQQQARKMIDLYANIDLLRPYFDIEPKVLIQRLISSFIPARTFSTPHKIPGELYGPLMTVFTLIAILLMNMKTSGTVLEQGTLMGTAFATCFGYWFGISGLMYFMAYICNAYITAVQCLSLLGYGMVSHCMILLLGHLTHYSRRTFYVLWALIAGISAARIVTVLMSRTIGKSQRLMLCISIASLHMLFLLYLHFAYHHVVEDIIDTLEAKQSFPVPDDTT